MVAHAAFGGSTNLVLHVPAIAHAAGLRQPTVDDWARLNRAVPRLVDALPNGPEHYATVQVFLAGGVPEVMLHLRDLGLLRLGARTVTGRTLGENLAWWETSERRRRLREKLHALDGIDPDNVIMSPARARERGLTSTITFLRGNLAPEGALVKSTAIAPQLIGADGVFQHEGPARVFTSEAHAIAAVKAGGVQPGDVMVLMGIGPGCGMPRPTRSLPHSSRSRAANESRWSPTDAFPGYPPAPASAMSARKPGPAARSAGCATATGCVCTSTRVLCMARSMWFRPPPLNWPRVPCIPI